MQASPDTSSFRNPRSSMLGSHDSQPRHRQRHVNICFEDLIPISSGFAGHGILEEQVELISHDIFPSRCGSVRIERISRCDCGTKQARDSLQGLGETEIQLEWCRQTVRDRFDSCLHLSDFSERCQDALGLPRWSPSDISLVNKEITKDTKAAIQWS